MPEQGAPEPDDPETGSSVPSPDDRLWRHPAEVAAAQRQEAARAQQGRSTRATASSPLAAAAVAALGGGLLITGMWLALGSTATPPVSAGDEGPAAAPRPVDPEVPTTVEIPGPGVVIRSDDGRIQGHGFTLASGDRIVTTDEIASVSGLEVVLPDGSTASLVTEGVDELTGIGLVRLRDVRLVTRSDSHAGRSGVPVDDESLEPVTVATDGPWSRAVYELEGDEAANADEGEAVFDDAGGAVGIVVDASGDAAVVAPMTIVARVAEQLGEDGVADHPWLGIEGYDGSRGSTGTDAGDDVGGVGVVVVAVDADGPAANSGLAPGDHIVACDDQPVTTIAELLMALRGRSPGDDVTVDVVTDDAGWSTTVELGRITQR